MCFLDLALKDFYYLKKRKIQTYKFSRLMNQTNIRHYEFEACFQWQRIEWNIWRQLFLINNDALCYWVSVRRVHLTSKDTFSTLGLHHQYKHNFYYYEHWYLSVNISELNLIDIYWIVLTFCMRHSES